jgi:chorismate mutase
MIMRRYRKGWPRVVGALATTLLVGLLTAACSGQPAAPGQDPLGGLAALAVHRIMTGDEVASAKFGSTSPIDDPVREQAVLRAAGAESAPLGVDPTEAAQFFRDQIEASKVVQRGLYERWSTHPEQRPAGRPDLGKQVRPELDQLTTAIMKQLQATNSERRAADCDARLTKARTEVAEPLDQLHRDALGVALRSVCVVPAAQ